MSNPRQEILNKIYTSPLAAWRPQLDTLSRQLSRRSPAWREQVAIYEQPPAPPAEFVTSPLYLGLGSRVYPVVLQTLEEVFAGHYNEAAICWGIGSGKSFFSSLAISYLLHRTLCLRDPQAYYGLAPGSAIAFLNMSASAGQAQRVVFNEIKQRVSASPWFRRFCSEARFGKHALQVLSEEIRLPKHLVVVTGNSAETCPLGYNLLGAVLDEAAFLLTTGDGRRDAAEEIYHALRRRITSRFFDRGLLVLISSPRHVGDFLERKLAEAEGSAGFPPACGKAGLQSRDPRSPIHDPREVAPRGGLYVSRRALWEVKPPHFYCGRFFEYEGLQIPVEYRDDFRRHPERALRDLAARPTRAYCAWFTDEQALEACCSPGAPASRPCEIAGASAMSASEEAQSSRLLPVSPPLAGESGRCAGVRATDGAISPPLAGESLAAAGGERGSEGFAPRASAKPGAVPSPPPVAGGGQGGGLPLASRVADPASDPLDSAGRWVPALRPTDKLPRYLHVDLGLRHDACGIAMVHCRPCPDRPEEPEVWADVVVRLTAPPGGSGVSPVQGEIDFARVRELINDLRRRGYNIAQVSFDGWQSVDSRQILRRQGFRTALVSVDRDLGPYETLKELVNTGRLHFPRYEPLLRELKRLELVDGRKVDHPRGGSKDCADALAAATSEALKHWGGGQVGGRIV